MAPHLWFGLLLAATANALACSKYVIIDSRGTGEMQGESSSSYGMIDQVMAAIPGGSRYDTVYPASADWTQETTFIGSFNIAEFIQTGLQECPSQKYALIGYSQGATVTNEVLQFFTPSSPEGQSVEAVVLVGNPYHLPNREGNVDEICGTSTAGASGVLLPVANYGIPEAWYETGKIRDICFTNDPVCNGYNANDWFSTSHLQYGSNQSVQDCAAEFLVPLLS